MNLLHAERDVVKSIDSLRRLLIFAPTLKNLIIFVKLYYALRIVV